MSPAWLAACLAGSAAGPNAAVLAAALSIALGAPAGCTSLRAGLEAALLFRVALILLMLVHEARSFACMVAERDLGLIPVNLWVIAGQFAGVLAY